MKPFSIFISMMGAAFLAFSVGCGSAETKTSADADELSAWVAENPSPEFVPATEE